MTPIIAQSWSLELPDGWEVDQDETCISVWQPNGAGVLQFSGARKDELVTNSDLREFAEEYQYSNTTTNDVTLGDFSGIELCFDDMEISWRHWYLRSGSLLLFVTYNCDELDAGAEDEAVDAILAKLQRS